MERSTALPGASAPDTSPLRRTHGPCATCSSVVTRRHARSLRASYTVPREHWRAATAHTPHLPPDPLAQRLLSPAAATAGRVRGHARAAAATQSQPLHASPALPVPPLPPHSSGLAPWYDPRARLR